MGIYISCDPKSKKLYVLLLMFLLSYLPIILLNYSKLAYFNELTNIALYIRYISQILVIIPYLIINCFIKNKNNNNKFGNINSKNSIKDYIIFILVIMIRFFGQLILFLIQYKVENYYGLYFFNEINILFFLVVLIKLHSKTEIYIHRFVSLIVMIVLFKIVELLIVNIKVILVNIYMSLLSSIYFFYQQYLIADKNISFYKISFLFGLIDFIQKIFLDSAFNYFGYYYTYNEKLIKISIFFYEKVFPNLLVISAKSSLYIFFYIIMTICFYYIIFKFSIIHALVINIFLIFCDNLFFYISKGYSSILIFALVAFFIFLLINYAIFIEIIELSCYGLNRNTMRNMLKREKDEKNLEKDVNNNFGNDENNSIEIRGYTIHLRNESDYSDNVDS